MAIALTAAATAAEYRERNGRVSTSLDTLLGTLLTTVTRVVEKRIGLAPGMLVAQASETFVFDAIGGTTLYLRDRAGMQYLLRTVTADGIGVDGEQDGTYDYYELDFADAWVRGLPENAAAFSEPFTAVELLSHMSDADPVKWPDQRASIQIAGAWGWATTPGGVKERVIGIVRELVDTHGAGMANPASFTAVDDAIERIPAARGLMSMLETEYRYRLPI